MHKTDIADSEGVFTKTEETLYDCPKCKLKTAICKVWESSCGGYEDYKYTCQNKECNHRWWVDGIDS